MSKIGNRLTKPWTVRPTLPTAPAKLEKAVCTCGKPGYLLINGIDLRPYFSENLIWPYGPYFECDQCWEFNKASTIDDLPKQSRINALTGYKDPLIIL